jgi:3-hydroxyacyl-CoA dehydrogenase/enoyl-CoA hydratase/3-hydroxybutyryl-CoA epimerase/3-hydroxyacyl-CoA dehydrogenase/enoyl-CoA hydratase/3-hydroxybutyryl-CoA epimerase/enoyl-CoA isomerase
MSAPSPAVTLRHHEGIALLTLDQPGSRANTLGQAMLGELEAAITSLRTSADVLGLILLSGKPGMFIAGADLKELGGAKPSPELTRSLVKRGLDLVASIESLPFPTVAAIEGACMGGGLELALGFDYRLASDHPKTELGLPETKIGLIPGWGGTQRLTRLIGPSLAAEMICSGEPAKAKRALELGLVFDVVPSAQLLDRAIALLRMTLQEGQGEGAGWREARVRRAQPVGLSDEQASFAFAVATAQVKMKTGGVYPAPEAALRAIQKGANLPLTEALAIETEEFLPLVGSPISRNLINVFFMTQSLAKTTGAPAGIEARPVGQVGVVGAGLMGAGIAGAHVRRGVPTVMLDTVPAALEKGVQSVSKSLLGRVEIGRMTPQEAAGSLALLSTSLTTQALADRDVVIEAIVENEEAKKKLFAQVEPLLPPGAILASNTSTISISRMAQGLKAPERFAGLHFFNPVDRMQLVEVIRGEQTNDTTVATLVALARRIGKTPLVVRDCPGFLVNRVLFPYMNEALLLLEEGVAPRAIDKAAVAFGMPMGPITLQDLVGLDTSLYAGGVLERAFPERAVRTTILGQLVQAGRLGQKTGAGFYNYAASKGGKGADDPVLGEMLAKFGTRKELSLEEIQDRLFLPMYAEATRVLAEGIVASPTEVEMGLILGIGFPPYRGGILSWATSLGEQLPIKLAKFAALGARFQPVKGSA